MDDNKKNNNFFLNAYKKNSDLLKNSQLEVEKLDASSPSKEESDTAKGPVLQKEKTVKPFVFKKIASSAPLEQRKDNDFPPISPENTTERTEKKQTGEFSKTRISAIFLLLSGVDKAVQILKSFTSEEQEKLFKELMKVEKITEEECREVEKNFGKWKHLPLSSYPTGKEFMRILLQQLYGLTDGSTQFIKIAEEAASDEYAYLNKLSAQQLKDLLQLESDLVVSTVLTLLPSEKSAAVIAKMPAEKSAVILKMISSKTKINSETIKTITTKLNEKAKEIYSNDSIKVQGKRKLIEILRNSDPESAQNILNAVASENPELAKELQENIFTFVDVIKLPKKELEKGLKEYNNKEIAFLLKGSSDAVKTLFLTCVTQRRRELIKSEIQLLGAVKKSEVEEKRKEFLDYLKELEEAGKIRLRNDDIYVE